MLKGYNAVLTAYIPVLKRCNPVLISRKRHHDPVDGFAHLPQHGLIARASRTSDHGALMPYRLNPAWCATARLHTANPAGVRVGDAAMMLTVLGHLSTRVHDSRNRDAFEQNLLETSEGRGRPEPYDLVLPIGDLRRDLALRTRDHVIETGTRLRDMRNGDRAMVSSVTVLGDDLVFRIAPGPGAVTAHPYFARRVTRLPGRAGDAPYADRSYALIDPDVTLGFWTVGSVHAYLRLRTWLTSPSRVGLPVAPAHSYDDTGCLMLRAKPRELVERLGFEPARFTRSYLVTAFGRLRRDLAHADIDLTYTPSSDSRGHHYAKVSACIASRRPMTPEQEHELHAREPVVAAAFPTRPVSSSPAPEPEPVEPEADQDPEEEVERPPVRVPPGRIHLRLVPQVDAIAPTSSASIDTSPVTPVDDVVDDGEEYVWTDEDDEEEARTDHIYVPTPKAAAPVDASSDDEPVYDADGYEIPVDKRPHARPVYGVDGFDQHGYNHQGYGRNRVHWLTGLMDDEVSPGLKKAGVRGSVTWQGLPPTDRDRWAPSKGRMIRPPAETPWHSDKPDVWLSIQRDRSMDQTLFPIMIWQQHNRHDTDLWSIDPETLKLVHHYEAVATSVRDWDEIMAYLKDISVWADERPLDLGDLPADHVIAPGYDLAEVMSHCRR